MDKLIRDGRVIRGYIGIGGREIAPMHTRGGGIDQIQGIVVNEVSPGGPAANAGIQVNDVIVSVNGTPAVSAPETMDRWQKFVRVRSSLLKSCVTIKTDAACDGSGISGNKLTAIKTEASQCFGFCRWR